ncbi:uncharacterized protein LOC110036392 [Phalaenopsis equestris]|uniref:uncharacterized protein LOC110036392 n=1 Tax=Phalaenopsis equestris TaxID=78828 RepID=UPI0009E1EB82|nr:uncharacterized protein LOC110036392 [Phalaenopsis equestris]
MMKLKNKWNHLKKDWKLWKELKRGSTELGWDPTVPTAKKFKLTGIEPALEKKFDGMFTGVVATGAHFFTLNEQGFANLAQDMETKHIGDSEEGPSQIPTDIQSTGGTKSPRPAKNKKGFAFVRGSTETLIENCENNSKKAKDITIQKCVRILNTYPAIKEDQAMYVKYVKLLGNSTRRKFFETLDTEFRLPYLRAL